MNLRVEVERYHKPLSVCIFGGGTLVLLITSVLSYASGNVGLAIGLGVAFVVVAVPVALYFLDMFVWEPRRAAAVSQERMQEFNTTQEHRRDRMRQRAKGLPG